MYRIQVTTHYEQIWRYNTVISCGGYNTLQEPLYVAGCERITSEELQSGPTYELTPPPNFDPSLPLILECDSADNIHAIIYVIAHTLPLDRSIEESPPFPIMIQIFRDDKEVYAQQHEVNQWGGATVNIKI
ncbi:MAG: hypothetical protein R3Y39_05410 [Rikenellaceae bacterium]